MILNYVLCPILVQNTENVHFEGMYIFPLHQHTAARKRTRDDTPVISPPHRKHQKTGLYQGLEDCCEGDSDSDLNCLASALL